MVYCGSRGNPERVTANDHEIMRSNKDYRQIKHFSNYSRSFTERQEE